MIVSPSTSTETIRKMGSRTFFGFATMRLL